MSKRASSRSCKKLSRLCQSTIFAFGSTSQEVTISIQKSRNFSYFRKAVAQQSASIQENEALRSRNIRAHRLLAGHIQARQMHGQWQNARREPYLCGQCVIASGSTWVDASRALVSPPQAYSYLRSR